MAALMTPSGTSSFAGQDAEHTADQGLPAVLSAPARPPEIQQPARSGVTRRGNRPAIITNPNGARRDRPTVTLKAAPRCSLGYSPAVPHVTVCGGDDHSS